jgi:hypothetical protein
MPHHTTLCIFHCVILLSLKTNVKSAVPSRTLHFLRHRVEDYGLPDRQATNASDHPAESLLCAHGREYTD